MSPEPHIAGTELEDVDALFAELTSVEVEVPPWSAVVDRIAVAPTANRPRFAFGWSAVLAGAVVAVAVGVAGAVSEPVRETVFEPVANLLPWVDDGPEDPPVPTVPGPVVSDRPTDQQTPVEERSPAVVATDPTRDQPHDGGDRVDDGEPTRPDEIDRIVIDERDVDPVPTTVVRGDRLTDREQDILEESRRRLEARRRQLEQERRDAERDATQPTTTTEPAPAPTDAPTDVVERDGHTVTRD